MGSWKDREEGSYLLQIVGEMLTLLGQTLYFFS